MLCLPAGWQARVGAPVLSDLVEMVMEVVEARAMEVVVLARGAEAMAAQGLEEAVGMAVAEVVEEKVAVVLAEKGVEAGKVEGSVAGDLAEVEAGKVEEMVVAEVTEVLEVAMAKVAEGVAAELVAKEVLVGLEVGEATGVVLEVVIQTRLEPGAHPAAGSVVPEGQPAGVLGASEQLCTRSIDLLPGEATAGHSALPRTTGRRALHPRISVLHEQSSRRRRCQKSLVRRTTVELRPVQTARPLRKASR